MPASVYKLVLRDHTLDKLVPSKLLIGTYTNDTVKIMGACKLYLVHPDTKKLIETTFFVATNDSSMLLSCKSTLALGLIQPISRLDYLPPRASLITSSQDHPKRTKPVPLYIHRSQQVATPNQTASSVCSNTSNHICQETNSRQVKNKQRTDSVKVS